MLDRIRKGQRWLTIIFIAVIGGVFVFFLGLGGPLQPGQPAGDYVVQLDDSGIDRIAFERVRSVQESRMREALGDNFDSRAAEPYLDQQALRSVVEQVVLAHSAKEMGLVVTKQEVQRFVRDNFRDENGRFDQQRIVDLIERSYGSQRLFLETVEREFLVQKLVGLLYAQASVTDSELRGAIRSQLEQVSIAFVALDVDELPAGQELPQEEVEAYLAANEPALRAEYASRQAEFIEPERVRVRHLLIQTSTDDDEAALAAAKDRAQAARERIAAGADFADVARELSEDEGTRENGGELGLVSRSEINLALSEVAFALEPGALSDVVKSDRGFHVVRIDEKLAGGQRSFEDVAPELARAAATATAAQTRAQELTTTLADDIRGGASLEDAAREQELTLVRTAPLRRRPDGYIPDLGAAPEVLATAFALEPGSSSPRVFEVGKRLVMLSVTSKEPADEAVVESQLAGSRDPLLQAKRQDAVRTWIDAEQTRLSEAGRLRIDSSLVVGS